MKIFVLQFATLTSNSIRKPFFSEALNLSSKCKRWNEPPKRLPHFSFLFIAVEKVTKNSQPLYITYFQTNGRKTNIYFTPGDHPYLGRLGIFFFIFFFENIWMLQKKNLRWSRCQKKFYFFSYHLSRQTNGCITSNRRRSLTMNGNNLLNCVIVFHRQSKARKIINSFFPTAAQAREPIDKEPEDGLTIRIQDDSGWQNIYRFTWNGDKLIEGKLIF